MLELSRLPIERQRNVCSSLAAHLATKPKYKAEVIASAKAVLSAGEYLSVPSSTEPQMIDVDRATDSLTSSVFHIIESIERAGVTSVIPLDGAAQKSVDAARALRETWFASGVGFIQRPYGIQWDAMNAIANTFAKETVKDAISTLALDALIAHWAKHITLYGRTLGITAPLNRVSSQDDNSDAFHKAYVRFAACVTALHGDDEDAVKALLGPYQQQLDEFAIERKNASKKRKKAAEATNETE